MEGVSYCDECECSMPQDEYLEYNGLCEYCSRKENGGVGGDINQTDF